MAQTCKRDKEGEGGVQWLDGDRAALCLTATLALSPTVARGRPLLQQCFAVLAFPCDLSYAPNISEKSLRGHSVAFARAARRTPILLGREGNCGAHSRIQPSCCSSFSSLN